MARNWNYVGPMQSQRCSAGVAVLGGKLYAVGGRDGASCLRTVECYDPHTNKWTSCASMTRRRGGVGVAVANGFLYAMGGQDAPANNPAACRYDCVERYDPSKSPIIGHIQIPCQYFFLCCQRYGHVDDRGAVIEQEGYCVGVFVW